MRALIVPVLAILLGTTLAAASTVLAHPATTQETPLARPDFEAYFPDDAEGGLALDRYHADRSRAGLGDEAYIALVRSGLRRTTTRKLFVLREFGNRFVWGKHPQRADAIELMFHAADPRPEMQKYDTLSNAVYFGLSVVNDKAPRILDALVDIAMKTEKADTIGRIAWGASDEKDELIARLQPLLASEDPATAEKARDLLRIFRGEESARERSRRRAVQKAREEYAAELPGIRRALREGTSEERRAALDRMWETSLILIMEKDALADFEEAAKDEDESVRRDVVRIVGGEWIWSAAEQSDPVIQLMLRMSRDEAAQVRYDSVYYGLSTVRESRRDVVARLLEMHGEPPNSDLHGRITWGLRGHGPMVKELLLETLRSDDASKASKTRAHATYVALLREAPPVRVEGVMAADDLVGSWRLSLAGPGGREGAGRIEITKEGREFRVASSEGFELPATRLLVVQRGDSVVAGAGFEDEHEGLVLTMTLSDSVLEGTLMHAHERLLMPFSGVRDAR